MKKPIFFTLLVIGVVLLSCGCMEPQPVTQCPNGTVEISVTNNFPQGDYRYAKVCGCVAPNEVDKYENLTKMILEE